MSKKDREDKKSHHTPTTHQSGKDGCNSDTCKQKGSWSNKESWSNKGSQQIQHQQQHQRQIDSLENRLKEIQREIDDLKHKKS
jgi:TolA-binding protein